MLLVLGLFTRFGALGLFAVNAMAVISYWHVLGGEGFEAALAQHVLWGYMLAVIAVCGAGALSLDEKLGRTVDAARNRRSRAAAAESPSRRCAAAVPRFAALRTGASPILAALF